MSKYSFLALLFILSGLNMTAQDCDCKTQFQFVKNYFERNNPAFQNLKSKKQSLAKYKKEVQSLEKEVAKETNNDLCNIYFDKYIDLLKDHHSSSEFKLERKKIDFSSKTAIDSFKSSKEYKAFKKLDVDTLNLIEVLNNKTNKDIEGIYISDSKIKVGIIKSKESDLYQGIVLKKNKLLDIGHVLFELKPNGKGTFDCYYNLGLLGFNFQTAYLKNVESDNGMIHKISFYKPTALTSKDDTFYEFKELNDKTYYLALKSFDYSLASKIDSLYNEIIPKIENKKNLIIDLRNNGGGSEQNYFRLLSLLYTKPLKIDTVKLWVSPDNISSYENFQEPNEILIERMKQAEPFSFIDYTENATKVLTMEGTKYPEKVAILFNHVTASSAEGLIAYAVQSDKVITLGENSGGFMGYGNVITVDVPCSKFTISTTTTKYDEYSQYEFVGITPMFKLDNQEDWVKVAESKLGK